MLLRPGSYQRDLDEEMRFHLSLDAMQQEHAARGALSPADAGFAARRRYGNVAYLKEETRRMSGLGFFDVLRQDVRFALKSFGRTPGFSAVAVLTLAVGIGANTAIFSAVNTLLLRPLPFPEPERLMQVSLTTPATAFRPAGDGMVWSYPKYEVFRDQQRVFADAGLFTTGVQVTLRAGGEAERDEVELTGGGYLSTLGIRPTLGRGFLPEEHLHPGGPRVALLSDALWASRFNADPGVIGRAVEIDNQPYTIVGVLPPGFRGLSGRSQLWVPIASMWPGEMAPAEAWAHGFNLVARLKPGMDPWAAREAVRLLGTRVDAAYPDHEETANHWGATARPLDATRVDPRIRRSLFVLLGAVGLVLLIACANVANLFLVRAAGRRREIAVRLAVGAGRGRLVRQLLTESILLSVLGGAASIFIAWWGVHVLAAINPSNALRAQRLGGLGAVSFESIHLDLAAFACAAALTLVTGFVFGLIPALQATRPSLTGELKEGGDPAPGGRAVRAITSRNVLAALEISLALVLLSGSGLMLRSFGNLLRVKPGFDSRNVLTLRLNTPDHFGRDSLPGFYDRMLERLSALPGVTGTALVDCPPLNGGCNGTDIIFRDRPPSKPGSDPAVGMHWVSPAWTRALGVPLLRGRGFTAADRLGAQKVVLVNETAARTFWPGQEAIGRPVSLGQGGFWRDTAYVVGVVGDVRFETLDASPKPDAYVSYYQSPRGRMMVFLRTAGDPLSVAGPARQVLRDLAPEVPTYDVRTLRSRTADAMSYARFSALLLALFAGVALALATLGVYGVISFAVSQRTREIGIRMALGAARGDVVRLVVGQGVALAAVGGVVGLGAALVATRVLRSLLYDVAPSDPATFVAIAILLAGAAVVASWIPARRAARVDPVTALKAE